MTEISTPDPAGQTLTATGATSQEVIQQQVTTQNYAVLRYAVFGLNLAIVLSLLGTVGLAYLNRELPEGVIAMGSAAVGALATLLVRPTSNRNGR